MMKRIFCFLIISGVLAACIPFLAKPSADLRKVRQLKLYVSKMSDVRDLVGPATNTSKDGDLQFWTYRSKATNPKEPMQNAGVRTQHVAVIAFDAQGVVIAASMHSIHDDPRSTNAEAASNPFDDVTVIIGETKIGALRQRFGRPAREVWNLNGQEQLIYKKRGGTQVQKVTFHFNSGYLAKVEK